MPNRTKTQRWCTSPTMNGWLGLVWLVVGIVYWLRGDQTSIAVTFTALGVVFLAMGAGARRSADRPGHDRQ